ncbi:hypothetical protein FPOA_13672 [Fusarium poae]|uniref:Uncharacterized protein n=1 Tax=Fusarium poae TaxID=36050 RepID=A0A1B8A4R7_FUSPO|nr:hypothetical protein FPOA_13672 [Fusarium poae]
MVTAVASAIFVTTLNNTIPKNVHKYVVPAIAKTGASPAITEALALAIASGNTTAIAGIHASPAAIQQAVQQCSLPWSSPISMYYISLAFGRLTTEIPRRLQDVGKQRQSDSEAATPTSDHEK